MNLDPNAETAQDAKPDAGDEPVAYDKQGRPLYLHPPDPAQAQTSKEVYASESPQIAQAQYVHIARPLVPEQAVVPAYIQELHEKSRKQYPQLNLSEGEYIIASVDRHPIGLVQVWAIAVLFIVAMIAVLVGIVSGGGSTDNSSIMSVGVLVIIIMSIFVLIGAFISTYIYKNNRFYLTNESVIQEIQAGIMNKREQTVSLLNVEDASYTQRGLMSYMFNYGAIRLSTEGEESTYRFNYVANPKETIATLNNAVEAFKNGRPVEGPRRA